MGGCGALMARRGLLTPAGAKVVAGLILNYTLPALLFAKMLSCVSMDNIVELGYVAIVAVFLILMGAAMGFLIQKTGLVPKRLHRGIIAATMFTNFGDLPISILLAVSDHPPFIVGDGARGTAYSSVFIAVFYLFLFPLGGYRLIRYDHIKEAKRLGNLTASLENHDQPQQHRPYQCPVVNTSQTTLSENNATPSSKASGGHSQHPTVELHQRGQRLHSPSLRHARLDQGNQTTFSATSTVIEVDYTMEDGAKELRYRQHDHELREDDQGPRHLRDGSEDSDITTASSSRHDSSPFNSTPRPQKGDPTPSSSPIASSPSSSNSSSTCPPQYEQTQRYPLHPLQNFKAIHSDVRYSVESIASNGTGVTRCSTGHDDDHQLIESSMSRRGLSKKSGPSPLFKGYQPPPLLQQPPLAFSASAPPTSSKGYSQRPTSPRSPYIELTPPEESSSSRNRLPTSGVETLATIPLEPLSSSTTPMPSTEPLPKVPPALSSSYTANQNKTGVHRGIQLFWQAFHSTREYLTPPTIGLLLGLLTALTPLRVLFVVTDTPVPSPDELPPLSVIHEITLMLGGCCVPLGLTVLGASLSRLKPGRMRPLMPTLVMITVAKMIISPIIGIALVQLVLVRSWGWVPEKNHMMQFTLMLMSGSPTSITCFVLAQVWDRRSKNAGGEMAALIAVQYGVGIVLITMLSACMMYFLF
ncbi:Protein M3 [Lunasporangiospora selenospora]|uniref:Protein M3 n=1 Tax=Lunasporangiospora selenospora TaxID=979761 RepID=A0A9P6FN85_9FUNG|nr:Protein M3 [Lunasporangiospora selenospora]